MINYRLAESADNDTIAQLHAISWQHTYKGMISDEYLQGPVLTERQTAWQTRFAKPHPHQFVMLAEENGQTWGFICLFGHDDPQWGTLLDNLHIHPTAHGRGIGKALMRHAADWLIYTLGDPKMHLIVFEANEGACKFYERLGGRTAEKLPQPMPDGVLVPSLRYVWDDVSNYL